VLLVGFLTLFVFDQLVVDVLQSLQTCNSELLVLCVAALLEFVVVDAQNLQVILQFAQVVDSIFEVAELVGSDRQDIQLLKIVETTQGFNFVLKEREVS